jgi:hypothetical protein
MLEICIQTSYDQNVQLILKSYLPVVYGTPLRERAGFKKKVVTETTVTVGRHIILTPSQPVFSCTPQVIDRIILDKYFIDMIAEILLKLALNSNQSINH